MKSPDRLQNSFERLSKRRKFLTTLTKVMGTSVLITAPGLGTAENIWFNKPSLTVGQVIDLILKTIPNAPFPKTVDTLKSGNMEQQVTGIVTSSFATLEVIEKAIGLGANFIIVHEPTFYNHLDETEWLEKDTVYQLKRDLLRKHNIAVWRFHDYWHSHRPDGVQMGVLTALGWEKYVDQKNPRMLTLPATPLGEIIKHTKEKLKIAMVRVIGDTTQSCERVLLMPGASGGKSQIGALQQEKPDLLICGEVSEWETAEYVRDAHYQKQKLALVVLGHAVSEEPGMQWLKPWLQPKIAGTKITHIPSQNPFTFV